MKQSFFSLALLVLGLSVVSAQEETGIMSNKDSDLTINNHHGEEENTGKLDKVHHAEPLYIDLIRDLGARKGEKEWNVGMGITNKNGYYEFTPLVEYEWAIKDRWALEVELPFTLYGSIDKKSSQSPGSKLDGIKLATQYTFLVSKKSATSMAVGYIHEFEFNAFRDYSQKVFVGNLYNPFFVVAKAWNHDYHTMIYTGPKISHHFENGHIHTTWQINTNFHYTIPGTKNFVGLEINKEFDNHYFNMVLRPQMRVALKDNLILGLVVGVPTNTQYEGFSGFARLIWEPHGKKDKKTH